MHRGERTDSNPRPSSSSFRALTLSLLYGNIPTLIIFLFQHNTKGVSCAFYSALKTPSSTLGSSSRSIAPTMTGVSRSLHDPFFRPGRSQRLYTTCVHDHYRSFIKNAFNPSLSVKNNGENIAVKGRRGFYSVSPFCLQFNPREASYGLDVFIQDVMDEARGGFKPLTE